MGKSITDQLFEGKKELRIDRMPNTPIRARRETPLLDTWKDRHIKSARETARREYDEKVGPAIRKEELDYMRSQFPDVETKTRASGGVEPPNAANRLNELRTGIETMERTGALDTTTSKRRSSSTATPAPARGEDFWARMNKLVSEQLDARLGKQTEEATPVVAPPTPKVVPDDGYTDLHNELGSWATDVVRNARRDQRDFYDRGGHFVFQPREQRREDPEQRNMMLEMMMRQQLMNPYPEYARRRRW